MALGTAIDSKNFVGQVVERLTLDERFALAGKWVATEIYTPETTPLRRIQSIGDTPGECARDLAARDLDPKSHQFELLKQPYRA